MADNVGLNSSQKRTFEMAFCETSEPKDVFIAIVKSMKTEDICSYFEQYGEIESIGLTIRFKDKLDANNVLQRRHHKVGNHILTAEEPRALPKINNYKLVPSPRKHILDLNDKCLKKIGSYLNEELELVTMSATCVRLKEIAEQLFAVKHKGNFEVNLGKTSIIEAREVLKSFGATIDTLTLTSECHDDEYWSDDESWRRHDTEMPTALKLASDYCGQTLRELRVNDDEYLYWRSFTVNYPKLERLYWNIGFVANLDDCCGCPNLSNFITPLPRLKEFTCTGYMSLPSETLIEIVGNWPKIEKFCYRSDYDEEIEFTEEMMISLCKLKSLQSLDISCTEIDIQLLVNYLLQENIPLESLTLCGNHYGADEIINGVSKFKRIKILKMPRVDVKVRDLIRLARSLPLLEELKLRLCDDYEYLINELQEMVRNANQLKQLHLNVWNPLDKMWEINTVNYQILADVVKRRAEKRKLSIKIRGKIGISNIDAEVIERNREWLEISRV